MEMPLNIESLGHEETRLMGDGATDPIEPPWSALAALLLLAGIGLLRRRALPVHSLTARSGLSNCCF
jgi:MYXO-CTERM domain-containing protein